MIPCHVTYRQHHVCYAINERFEREVLISRQPTWRPFSSHSDSSDHLAVFTYSETGTV